MTVIKRKLPPGKTPAEQVAHKRDREKFVFHFMDLLTAPILTHSVAWKDAIPQRLIQEITMQRLISSLHKEELATYAETCAFIMTRTFDAPMDHDWTEIYLHVSCTVCQECWGEDHWEELRAPRKLNDYQAGMLKHLRRWIYEKRRQHVKTRVRADAHAGFSIVNEQYFND